MAAMLGSGELQAQMVGCPDPACGFRCMRASAPEVDAQVAQALRAHAARPVRGEWLPLLVAPLSDAAAAGSDHGRGEQR